MKFRNLNKIFRKISPSFLTRADHALGIPGSG